MDFRKTMIDAMTDLLLIVSYFLIKKYLTKSRQRPPFKTAFKRKGRMIFMRIEHTGPLHNVLWFRKK
jgi:hypothetical protein